MFDKRILNADEAAAYLGITPDELLKSFYRGLPPGNLAVKKDGRLTWDRTDLLPPPRTSPPRATSARQGLEVPLGHVGILDAGDARLACGTCGKEYKTTRGLTAHIEKLGH